MLEAQLATTDYDVESPAGRGGRREGREEREDPAEEKSQNL